MRGIIINWVEEKGFGFIRLEKYGKDVFCHSVDVKGAYDLDLGDRVEFKLRQTTKGPKAVHVKIIQ